LGRLVGCRASSTDPLGGCWGPRARCRCRSIQGRGRQGMIFVGVDWAEAHHDVLVQNEDGKRLGGGRLPEGMEGIARFHAMVAAHVGEPGEVVIGIETDRGLFVTALIAAGYQVFAVNPMSTSRYRDRHSTSGAK